MDLTPEQLQGLQERLGWTPDRIMAVHKRVEDKQLTLSPDDIAALETQIDESFVQQFGRSFNDADMKTARVPPAVRNGDSAHVTPDSLARVRRDFPLVFGESRDE